MTEVVVIYDSKTGFTELMAKAVAEGVRSVIGVEVVLRKVGMPFSISKIDLTDAIIIGSPSIYGCVTSEMRSFLESMKENKESKALKLSGKIGGAFGSYAWDGGWVADKLSKEIKALGIKVVAPPVSIVNATPGQTPIHLDEKSTQRCLNLGRSVAEKLLVKSR